MKTKAGLTLAALALIGISACSNDPQPTDAMKERYETGCALVDQKFAELEAAMRKEMGKDASKAWANEMQSLPDMCTDGKLDKKKATEWVTPGGHDDMMYNDEDFDEDGHMSSGELHQLGDEVAWPSGSTITVKDLKTFTPEFDEIEGTAIKVTVVMTNNTDQPFEPSDITVGVVSGDMEAEPIYDDEAGVGEYPETVIRPGDTRKFDVGFDVADPDNVVVNVSPDLMTTEAWTN